MRIAARKSDLARLQAYRVGQALQAQNAGHSPLEIQYFFSSSLGDQNQSDPLWQMPEKGVFTEDLTKKLMAGECDAVVHSWKDLPVVERTETVIVATLPRADARDVILFRRERVMKKPAQLKILSSSPRRALSVGEFLKWALPFQAEVEFCNVRGNILTRVKKLISGEADALVVAKAALDRLLTAQEPEFLGGQRELRRCVEQCVFMVVPLSANPGAAAQGALAIEVRRDRPDLLELFGKINCRETYRAVEWERATLQGYGGGCHQKIGLTRVTRAYGDLLFRRGETDQGERLDDLTLVSERVLTPVAKEKVFPLEPAQDTFFMRERLPVAKAQLQNHDLFVARANGLPEGYAPEFTQLIWTSGVTTWQKLAARGCWISGTQDSLGEDDTTWWQVAALLGREPHFLKLSHSEALETSPIKTLATYRLVKKPKIPDLSAKTHFYWMSFSQFEVALEASPSLAKAHHACGPGHTYRLLQKALGPSAKIEIFLSHSDWLRAYVGEF